MNNLGGMVFIVAGIAMGYWVATGKAAGFLHAVNQGSQTTSYPLGYNPNTPLWQALQQDIPNINSGVNPAVNSAAAAQAAGISVPQNTAGNNTWAEIWNSIINNPWVIQNL